jgi:hypothetical protein
VNRLISSRGLTKIGVPSHAMRASTAASVLGQTDRRKNGVSVSG